MDIEFEARGDGGFSWTGGGFKGVVRARGGGAPGHERWLIEGHSEAGGRFEGSLEGSSEAARQRVRALVVEHAGEGVGGGD